MKITPKILENSFKKICYRELGNGKRKILFFHGFPGSSGQIDIFEKHLDDFDLHVICVDRPGYNQSDQNHASQGMQFNQDLASVIRHLGWDQFELVTVSGGTPFMFSFIRSFNANAFTNVSIVCGLGAVGDIQFKKAMGKKSIMALNAFPHIPKNLLTKLFRSKDIKAATRNRKIVRFFLPISKPDLKVLQDTDIQTSLIDSLYEAFGQAGIGPKADAIEYMRHTDLSMGAYKGAVQIWHGKKDKVIPFKSAELTHKRVPNSTLHLVEEEGHYSLPILRLGEILEAVPTTSQPQS